MKQGKNWQPAIRLMIERIIAAVLLVLLLPVFLLIFLGYLAAGKRQIMFTQKRIGRGKKTFRLYKFKTLTDDETLPLQQRQFGFGRLLRRSSLDELPQLINILLGQMSFIGPRPLPVEYLPWFTATEKLRFTLNPGITGWAQVNGGTAIPWDKKLALDNFYVKNKSCWLDIKIILKTIKVFVNRKDDALNEKSFIEFAGERQKRTEDKRAKGDQA